MIVYHGTTSRRARKIAINGFLPRKPSRRVWFSRGKGYAEGRAKTQARRSHDRPVVLTCEIDMAEFRRRLGKKRVFTRAGVIAIDGAVPVTVLRTFPGQIVPTSPDELARWMNRLLGLRRHKGVGGKHPGLQRLSRWVANRLTSEPNRQLQAAEVVQVARQWLGEFFEGVEIDWERLRARHRARPMKTVELEVHPPEPTDAREQQALECLEADKPRRRVRGLELLAEIDDPDLSDWCTMFLDDPAPAVRVAALRRLLDCAEVNTGAIAPLASSADGNVRAAAIAALARHGGAEAAGWFERGLKDPSACVRLATARQLEHLDATRHRAIFELALYDSNPTVVRLARKLAAGKGFAKVSW